MLKAGVRHGFIITITVFQVLKVSLFVGGPLPRHLGKIAAATKQVVYVIPAALTSPVI